jgi:hypothetical protein
MTGQYRTIALDYCGYAATFPVSQWPPWLTVSPVSMSGRPGQAPGNRHVSRRS